MIDIIELFNSAIVTTILPQIIGTAITEKIKNLTLTFLKTKNIYLYAGYIFHKVKVRRRFLPPPHVFLAIPGCLGRFFVVGFGTF